MSILPGLGLTAPSQEIAQPREARQIEVPPTAEWRFEVAPDSNVSVKVLPPSSDDPKAPTASDSLTGTAEIFGTELTPNREYEFPGLSKAAIFSHHGCTLAVTGNCESEYVAEETPMKEYLNVHFALENLRASHVATSGGPRVLVVGPENAGKTSLVKMLSACAIRSGHSPMVVSLDPKEGMLCLPGSLSTAVMGTGAILDVEDAASGGWGSSPIGGPSAIPVIMPLVYHYGYAGPEERPEMFKPVTTRLALAATSRYMEDPAVREAGILVDMAGSITSAKRGNEIIQHVVSEFSINVLLVIGSERLYNDLAKRFSPTATQDEQVHVLKLPKSGGCVDRDETYMRQRRQAQFRTYFFGSTKNTLSPHTIMADLDSLTIFRTLDQNPSLDFLPGGSTDDDDLHPTTKPLFEKARPSMAMQNALLAVKHAAPSDPHDAIRDASVMGYLYVADVDEGKKKVRILSPVGGRLPNRALVWGGWPEGVGDLVG